MKRPGATPDWDRDADLVAAVRADGRARCAAYRCPGVEVVLGRGGRDERELRLENVRADGVPVRRRAGGGCAVVLDPGNLVVSVVLPRPGVGGITAGFASVSAWLIRVLAAVGVPGVRRRGVSDLALGERKIGGSCIHRTRGLLHYATTLLVTPDLDLVERYLQHPPREPDYRRGRSHRDFMGDLTTLAGVGEPGAFLVELEAEMLRAGPPA